MIDEFQYLSHGTLGPISAASFAYGQTLGQLWDNCMAKGLYRVKKWILFVSSSELCFKIKNLFSYLILTTCKNHYWVIMQD